MAFKLNKNQREAIARYLEILSQTYREQISKVILFGSVARRWHRFMDEQTRVLIEVRLARAP